MLTKIFYQNKSIFIFFLIFIAYYFFNFDYYNNLSAKDPVALNLFTQKDLVEAIEKAERRIKREKKIKEKQKQN